MTKRTHQPKGDGKVPGAIPDLPSAIRPPDRIIKAETFGQMIGKIRDEASGAEISNRMSATEIEAREMVKDAGITLAKAVRAYEEAAVALMACNFKRGMTVATWAKDLRARMDQMNLEGA